MSHSNKSRRQSIGFIDALGIWTMAPETSRRSSRHGSRHDSRRESRHESRRGSRHNQGGISSTGSTAASRAARLANAPPGLNLTASQWRQYADVPPGYKNELEDEECDCGNCHEYNNELEDEECDCGNCHEDEMPQPRLPAPEPEADRFRSAWSHSEGSALTRVRRADDRRVSRLNRLEGERSSADSSGSRLRHQVSYDANNDALFANIPRSDGSRRAGEIIIHRQGPEGLPTETFGQRDMYVHPLHDSQFFVNPREAPPVPQYGSDVRPGHPMRTLTPQERQSRIQSWREELPEGHGPEPSVFGGSNASTVWPGPRGGGYAGSVAPEDSATQVMGPRYGNQEFHAGYRTGGGHSRRR
ncbi:hypothetical protein HG530_001791 [Fusarium avenaceum]|nr:hypothetical protein HG530_001791 [Fusarium avenaceum]